MASYLRSKDRMSIVTYAYLYKWTHIPTQKWYVGSRTAIGSHPDDGYICSSKIVKPLITENKNEWRREVLAIGEPLYIRELESQYLSSVDAKNDTMSFNLHNGDGKFTTAGMTGKNMSIATRNKLKLAFAGIPKSKEHCEAIRVALLNSHTVQNRKGEQTSRFIGYYVSPDKQKYASSWDAAAAYGHGAPTIRRWAKNNKNGWSFESKVVNHE